MRKLDLSEILQIAADSLEKTISVVKKCKEGDGPKSKYCIYSKDGKKLGGPGSKSEMQKRLREIEFFKNKDSDAKKKKKKQYG